jgi:hypothetical protein
MADIAPMSKKQAQFFAGLILICTITAALVLVIDYQIKGAILEQANRLRLDIERWTSGQKPEATGSNRPDSHPDNDVLYPSDLVDSGTTRVETSGTNGSANGTVAPNHTVRSKPSRRHGPSTVSDTDK